jgi:NAD(P)-dependent dehydrogenase (short-subunit alcohol dehydrogenase family)
MAPPVLLLFGAGANVGLSVIKKFRAEGYKVAGVSRNPSDELKKAADKTIPADLSQNPEQIAGIFDEIGAELGTPTVVVYNGADCFSSPVDVTMRRNG